MASIIQMSLREAFSNEILIVHFSSTVFLKWEMPRPVAVLHNQRSLSL